VIDDSGFVTSELGFWICDGSVILKTPRHSFATIRRRDGFGRGSVFIISPRVAMSEPNAQVFASRAVSTYSVTNSDEMMETGETGETGRTGETIFLMSLRINGLEAQSGVKKIRKA
jgi:hypothetical protein